MKSARELAWESSQRQDRAEIERLQKLFTEAEEDLEHATLEIERLQALLTEHQNNEWRLQALLNDKQYIQTKADYNKGHLSHAGWLAAREEKALKRGADVEPKTSAS